jgi:hypothetical protein
MAAPMAISKPTFMLDPNLGHGGSVTSPSQLLILPGHQGYVDLGVNHDETLPPAAAEQRQEFLQELKRLLSDIVGLHGNMWKGQSRDGAISNGSKALTGLGFECGIGQ